MTRPTRPQQTAQRKPPLAASVASTIAHPVFPVISGLWFAALFGLGALVAGGEALAALVGHLHLTTIMPSAAPPLGRTAHILIVIGLTGLGAVLGVVLGLVLFARAAGTALFDTSRIKAGLARARTAKPREAAKAAPVDAAVTPTPRVRNRDAHPDAPTRRPLVVTEDVLPYHAPGAPVSAAPADLADPVESIAAPPAWTAQIIESHDSTDFDAAPLGGFMTGHPAAPAAEHADEVPSFFAGKPGETPPLAQSGIYDAGHAIVLPPETGTPVERAYAKPVAMPDEAIAPDTIPHSAPMPLASQAAVAPHEPIVEAPVASLGLVQLIERLALAITVRQALRAEQGYHAVTAVHDEADHEPLLRAKPSRLGQVVEDVNDPVNDGPVAAAGHTTSSQATLHDPHAMSWAEASDDTLPPRFLRTPVELHPTTETSVLEATVLAPEDTFVAPPSIFGAPKAEESTEPQYSSLVDMAMARPAAVVPFLAPAGDNAAPAPLREHSDQADRALRDALATLRRMSAQR